MTRTDSVIAVKVDLTNPGEFFACCGLLELADRLWPGTQSWFDIDNKYFCMHVDTISAAQAPQQLVAALINADVSNTMTASQLQRRQKLATMSAKDRKIEQLDEEKKQLDKLWRESPILVGEPFNLVIDWFLDDYGGGSTFKTWAGQQSVIDIAIAMMTAIQSDNLPLSTSEDWFDRRTNSGGIPFNFDARLGDQGSDRDVGFSRDPLQIPTTSRPMVELLAFFGLQRCRPAPGPERNRYQYSVWTDSIYPELAPAISSGSVALARTAHFDFSLFYRTKYLKSFLPATPIGD